MASEPRDIVVIGSPHSDPLLDLTFPGGGIIGCTTAYFLTRHPSYDREKHKITILEASKIAGGASGKAGGLLALWGRLDDPRLSLLTLPAYPKSIVPLSFWLHSELAQEHDGAERWGYRRINCGQLTAKARKNVSTEASVSLQKRKDTGILRAAGIPADLDWFSSDSVVDYSPMGDPSNTAQVHPYQFTTSMAALAEKEGVRIVHGSAIAINRSDSVHSVSYKDSTGVHDLPATDVVISAGPWTKTVYPSAPISALRAHSVTIQPTRPVSAYAIFTEIKLPGKQVSPEIYARPHEIYACGEGDTLVPLSSTTADVETDPKRCQDIVDHVSSVSDELNDGKVLVRQACYLPNVQGAVAGPLIGPTRVKGLFMAAGHTCWGIQNGPGTGKLMSEFIFDGVAKSAKVPNLDPRIVL